MTAWNDNSVYGERYINVTYLVSHVWNNLMGVSVFSWRCFLFLPHDHAYVFLVGTSICSGLRWSVYLVELKLHVFVDVVKYVWLTRILSRLVHLNTHLDTSLRHTAWVNFWLVLTISVLAHQICHLIIIYRAVGTLFARCSWFTALSVVLFRIVETKTRMCAFPGCSLSVLFQICSVMLFYDRNIAKGFRS